MNDFSIYLVFTPYSFVLAVREEREAGALQASRPQPQAFDSHG